MADDHKEQPGDGGYFNRLEQDVLTHILAQLDNPQDLTGAGLVSKRLHEASISPVLWRTMTERKWHKPHHAAQPPGTWRTLFATCNGLLDTSVNLHLIRLPIGHGCSCMGVIHKEGQMQGAQVALGMGPCLCVINLGPLPPLPAPQPCSSTPQQQQQQLRTRIRPQVDVVDIAGVQTRNTAMSRPIPPPSSTPGPQGTPRTHRVHTAHACAQPTTTSTASPPPWQPLSHTQLNLPPKRDASAVDWSPCGQRLVVGTMQGTLHAYIPSDISSASTTHTSTSKRHNPQLAAVQHWVPVPGKAPEQRCAMPISDILHLGPVQGGMGSNAQVGACVAVLHDHMWACSDVSQQFPMHTRNSLELYSNDLEHHLGSVTDVMEGWQVMAIVSPNRSAFEIIVGSVAGPCCRRCWEAATPWLCHHKLPARTAALCMADIRTPTGIAARFSLHHRSLSPRLACARHHWVFTSHADRPLCVWDLRRMSVPLFEQDRLDNQQAGPLGCTTLQVEHQALWLTANDDVCLGRADNGCLWVWDLATLLGWADGTGMGYWEAMDHMPTWALPQWGTSGWPRCLGAPPLPSTALPATLLVPGGDALGVLTFTATQGWTSTPIHDELHEVVDGSAAVANSGKHDCIKSVEMHTFKTSCSYAENGDVCKVVNHWQEGMCDDHAPGSGGGGGVGAPAGVWDKQGECSKAGAAAGIGSAMVEDMVASDNNEKSDMSESENGQASDNDRYDLSVHGCVHGIPPAGVQALHWVAGSGSGMQERPWLPVASYTGRGGSELQHLMLNDETPTACSSFGQDESDTMAFMWLSTVNS